MQNQSTRLALTHLVAQPQTPTSTKPPLLVLLHGIGANEYDLFSLADYLDPRLLVISVRAPRRYQYGGFAWFDLHWNDRGFTMDAAQIKQSWQILQQFIAEAVDAYSADPQRVYLMGFSQGAIVSLGATLTRPDLVAGLVVMSGHWVPELSPPIEPEALTGLPIMAVHGLHDQVIPVESGRIIRDYLTTLPITLEYREYSMGHEVSMQSLRDINRWLTDQLDQSAS